MNMNVLIWPRTEQMRFANSSCGNSWPFIDETFDGSDLAEEFAGLDFDEVTIGNMKN
jgi:hypothetical protein